MKETRIIAVILGLLASVMAVCAGRGAREGGNKLQPLHETLNANWHFSALPPQLRDNATV